jgi:hypothetical protein
MSNRLSQRRVLVIVGVFTVISSLIRSFSVGGGGVFLSLNLAKHTQMARLCLLTLIIFYFASVVFINYMAYLGAAVSSVVKLYLFHFLRFSYSSGLRYLPKLKFRYSSAPNGTADR